MAGVGIPDADDEEDEEGEEDEEEDEVDGDEELDDEGGEEDDDGEGEEDEELELDGGPPEDDDDNGMAGISYSPEEWVRNKSMRPKDSLRMALELQAMSGSQPGTFRIKLKTRIRHT